ncbi:uroporphyrinogen-III synthase [Bacillus benzoevorans]|uniref:Uroporphyrinogen-III synthase n=1 Tax=Bacillus benzoevorans TaxID=1456 RepID=A0A7X0HS20_9BACI|nr:uroporphyrinogen-III synthase [Bacillus benzoevorans]MBB6445845.1 uroporphyrinogen-III synthase [Bacillus benzoevorans]
MVVKKYGGVPIELPLLAFKPAELSKEEKALIGNIHIYDWIIFTSNVTVETFLSFYEGERTQLPHVAAIGQKTARVLEKEGIKVDFIPAEFVAEGFVKEFAPKIKQGTKIFIPKGNLARDYIAEQLRKQGASVDEMIIYDTYFPQENEDDLVQLLSEHNLDIIPFTSPSTADHFMEIVASHGLQDRIQSCIFACIGPVAQKRAESLGLTVHVVPDVYTVDEMIKSIAEYISQGLE